VLMSFFNKIYDITHTDLFKYVFQQLDGVLYSVSRMMVLLYSYLSVTAILRKELI